MANVGRGCQIQGMIWVRFYNFVRAANGNDVEFAHVLIKGGQTLALFRSRERDRIVGADELANWVRFVRGQTGGNIDGHLLSEREPLIDHANGIKRRPFSRSG